MNIDDLPTDLRRRVIHYDPTGCWIWTGAVTSAGYGNLYLGGGRSNPRYGTAHRHIYEMLNAARACLKSGLEPIGDDQAGDEVGRWKWRGKAA